MVVDFVDINHKNGIILKELEDDGFTVKLIELNDLDEFRLVKSIYLVAEQNHESDAETSLFPFTDKTEAVNHFDLVVSMLKG